MTEHELFAAALAVADPAELAALLDRTCTGDAALRGRVEALLRAHARAGNFLAAPAVGVAELGAADTRTGPSGPDADEPLDFLEPSDKPGSLGRLGHYEVQEVVGRGGMGIVLKAFDETLHRVVAIKVMAPQLATSAPARRRFTREARAAAAVTHDHVVTTHAVDDAGPLPYIVMQFVAGQSLQERLDRSGPLPLAEILRIGKQTASGLAAAHAQGLVHRDVKPANILLENGVERVKLTDFGLARAADDASLTQSGTVAGTPAFMSPEQAEGKPVDHRSDLFSLGSVLYAMCTGRPPFRAGTSMGVLKRVCEDTPTPLREANPDVPDCLTEVITKLHAKDPAARFQSAAEVAELLGRHLARVQHPSVVQADASPPLAQPATRKRWAVAAAALVAMLAILGTTEATGVTNVRATVIRIFTPDGTLVVETDDPDVKVVVEGDGDLVITGAGPREVRLKAGSYRLHAVKDGKPVRLDRDLVAISRGDRQVVRVRLEDANPAAAVPKAETGAFVVLGGKGVGERKFDTLADAVQGASDGDTIEVRGNGPFDIDHIEFNRALTVRAGTGFRPVLTAVPHGELPYGSQLISRGPLRLEGLEIRCASKAYRILHANGPVWVSNCRFHFATDGNVCIEGFDRCTIRNSEMLSPTGAALAFRCHTDSNCDVVNCLLVGHINLEEFDATRGATLRFTRNTFLSPHNSTFLHCLHSQETPLDPLRDLPGKRVQLSVAESVIDSSQGLFSLVVLKELRPQFNAVGTETWVARRVKWNEEGNLYRPVQPYLRCEVFLEGQVPLTRGKDLRDWKRFWGLEKTSSSEGVIRFHGGDLLDKARTNHPGLTPEDFRLRPDSAGYKAGKDGKDLGAEVDLVGPGPAYERWKKTPDYQQWLKETGQFKK